MVTLDTVNLDENKADDCEPEIKVLATSGDGLLKGAAAKMRLPGSSTRLATLKSYRVKFDKGADWQGEDTLNLNKHPYDLTRVRNKLAFDLMRQVPYHQSLRTQFVEIRYDAGAGTGAGAQPMGLFTHIEKLGGKSYLERRGWVAGSNVYKVAAFNFNPDARLQTLADGKAGPGFEELLEIENDSGNHGAIVQTVKALADDGTPFATSFNRHFDRNNYLAWLASAILLGNWDTVNQNFGLYQPLGGDRFYFLPWDYDGALGYPQQPGAALYPQWNRGISAWWDSSLHRRFLTEPGNLALLQAAVEEIRSKHLTDAAVKQLLDGYRPIVEPILARARCRQPGRQGIGHAHAAMGRRIPAPANGDRPEPRLLPAKPAAPHALLAGGQRQGRPGAGLELARALPPPGQAHQLPGAGGARRGRPARLCRRHPGAATRAGLGPHAAECGGAARRSIPGACDRQRRRRQPQQRL